MLADDFLEKMLAIKIAVEVLLVVVVVIGAKIHERDDLLNALVFCGRKAVCGFVVRRRCCWNAGICNLDNPLPTRRSLETKIIRPLRHHDSHLEKTRAACYFVPEHYDALPAVKRTTQMNGRFEDLLWVSNSGRKLDLKKLFAPSLTQPAIVLLQL